MPSSRRAHGQQTHARLLPLDGTNCASIHTSMCCVLIGRCKHSGMTAGTELIENFHDSQWQLKRRLYKRVYLSRPPRQPDSWGRAKMKTNGEDVDNNHLITLIYVLFT